MDGVFVGNATGLDVGSPPAGAMVGLVDGVIDSMTVGGFVGLNEVGVLVSCMDGAPVEDCDGATVVCCTVGVA